MEGRRPPHTQTRTYTHTRTLNRGGTPGPRRHPFIVSMPRAPRGDGGRSPLTSGSRPARLPTSAQDHSARGVLARKVANDSKNTTPHLRATVGSLVAGRRRRAGRAAHPSESPLQEGHLGAEEWPVGIRAATELAASAVASKLPGDLPAHGFYERRIISVAACACSRGGEGIDIPQRIRSVGELRATRR